MAGLETFYKTKTVFLEYDAHLDVVFMICKPKPTPTYTLSHLKDIHEVQLYIEEEYGKKLPAFRYFVIRSAIKNVFNLGGDLFHFLDCAKKNKRDELSEYATYCIDSVFHSYTNSGKNFIGICLLEGTAYGGGLESALSFDFVFADEKIKIGFPELRFGMFPGMGAYSLLYRKIGTQKADSFIKEAKLCTAKEGYEMGIIDGIFEEGQGVNYLEDFINKNDKKHSGILACIAAKKRLFQKSDNDFYLELKAIVENWVELVLSLDDKNLDKMDRIIKKQAGKFGKLYLTLAHKLNRGKPR